MKPRHANDYRPTSRRQRLVIVAITVATVVALWMLLLLRPGFHARPIPGTPLAPCPPGQTSGCVGGKADVLLIPAAPASSPGSEPAR
ncbi:hypothetical protein [Ideonella sp.]|uniref:hypothetical protein n=1 Tax=Ideonella sp. TaxID=1929293 RepID=UPI002B48738E|nr:hypothetical protein [Ideonella sp.]HJV71194.1 hypothetical protein [Ideonella sp.]